MKLTNILKNDNYQKTGFHYQRKLIKQFKKVIKPYIKQYNLTNYSITELQKAKMVVLDSQKKAGYVLKRNGELANIFNKGKKGKGKYLLINAIENGARQLDCFDSKLVNYYKQFGFIEYKREKNWTENNPDVVFMKLEKERYQEFKNKNQYLYL